MPAEGARTQHLAREARVFCSYLIGLEASAYVIRKYAAYHEAHDISGPRAANAFDRILLALARMGGVATRLADVYASRFAQSSVLGRKLILAVAILECAPTTYAVFDRPFGGGRAVVWLRLVVRGTTEILWLLVATVLLAPVHAVLSLAGLLRRKRAT